MKNKPNSLPFFIYILILIFPSDRLCCQTLIPYRVDSLYGYADEAGNVKIDPVFDGVKFFGDRPYTTVEKNGKKLIIDTLGNPMTIVSKRFPEGIFEFDHAYPVLNSFSVQAEGYTLTLDSALNVEVECPFLSHFNGNGLTVAFKRTEKRKMLYTVIDDECNQLFPFSLQQPVLHDMTLKARKSLISFEHDGGIVVYDENGHSVLDSVYEQIKTISDEDDQLYLLSKGDEFDVLYDDLSLAYENLKVSAAFDATLYDEVKRRSGFSDETLMKIFNSKKGIQCFLSKHSECVCIDNDNRKAGSFINGEAVLKGNESFVGWKKDRELVYLNDEGGGVIVRTVAGQNVTFLKSIDSIIIDRKLSSIVAWEQGGYVFYDEAGNKLNDFVVEEYDSWKIKKMNNSNFAFHAGSGIPTTDFLYKDISLVYPGRRYLGEKIDGFTLLDSIGQKLLDIDCDSVYYVKGSSNQYWGMSKNGKHGVFNIDGEVIIPINYDKIELNQASKLSSGFRAYTEDVGTIYSPTGAVVKLNEIVGDDFSIMFRSNGYFRVYDRIGKINHFFAPNGDLIASRNYTSVSYGVGMDYDVFSIDGCYFNYKTGAYYCPE